MSNTFTLLRESINILNPSEQSACEYILNNPEQSVYMSIKELAEKSLSSPTTIMRLCKKLGYKGFSDFKISLSADIALYHKYSVTREENQYSIHSIIENVTQKNLTAISETSDLLSERKIERVLSYIEAASKIDFYGIGSSHLICLDAQKKFVKANKHVTAYEDPHMQWISAINSKENDAVFAISYSGETKEVLKGVALAKSKRAKIISITKFEANSLSNFADIAFYVKNDESIFREAAMSSRMSQLNVIDIIYTAYISKHHDSGQRIQNALNALGISIER